ncbi:MAG: endonuclease [Candidatus Komeilibacteria bacterium CG_4_10_14_0_2_um_filter_37_10]|uniref:Endonuclease n=1 Tax=Candidatus Komeilibacteria bacterium CG_4_10_14_0_2_um_filter_37_10 TaxID=1974470 RepID=A0A2M7VEI2_9BACT|nr:MAG: endonuclease [Candidatus Komeilibacteria bacterium CG_4_10_14_0_2_um_filter_37_10]
MSKYYVYVLVSKKDHSTYIGYTEDINKRLKEHNQGKTKSIKHKLPMVLKYIEEYDNKTLARKRELALKQNSSAKEKLFSQIFKK